MWKKLKSKWEEMGYDLVESEFRVWYPRIMAGASPYVIKEFDDDNDGNAVELVEIATQLRGESGAGAGGVSGKAKGKAYAVQEEEESGSEGSEAEGQDDGEEGEGYGEDREAEEESWRPTSRKSSGGHSRRGNMTIPIRRPQAQEAFDSATQI
jgi:hypothetical protein